MEEQQLVDRPGPRRTDVLHDTLGQVPVCVPDAAFERRAVFLELAQNKRLVARVEVARAEERRAEVEAAQFPPVNEARAGLRDARRGS